MPSLYSKCVPKIFFDIKNVNVAPMFLTALSCLQAGQEEDPRQETNERLHGVGSGGAAAAGAPVPQPPQRGAQQDAGQALEVSRGRTRYMVSLLLFQDIERGGEETLHGGGREAAPAAQEAAP